MCSFTSDCMQNKQPFEVVVDKPDSLMKTFTYNIIQKPAEPKEKNWFEKRVDDVTGLFKKQDNLRKLEPL